MIPSRWIPSFLFLLFLQGIGFSQGHPHYSNDNDEIPSTIGLVQVKSMYSFEETYDRLIATLSANANIRIVSEIDHTANAETGGLELENIRLVVFGNPNLGTPLMLSNQFTGLDLPQKMLVWETTNDDDVFVAYNSVDYLNTRYPGIKRANSFDAIAMALRSIAGAVTGVLPDDIEGTNVMDRRDRRRIRRMNGGLFQKRSNANFETTYNRLIFALENAPPSIAFQVDHSANAPDEFDLNPTRLVSFANPSLGTRLMQANPSAGIDLPLKILVTQDSHGKVMVSTNRISFLQYRHGLYDEGVGETLTTIRGAIMNFVRIAATGE